MTAGPGTGGTGIHRSGPRRRAVLVAVVVAWVGLSVAACSDRDGGAGPARLGPSTTAGPTPVPTTEPGTETRRPDGSVVLHRRTTVLPAVDVGPPAGTVILVDELARQAYRGRYVARIGDGSGVDHYLEQLDATLAQHPPETPLLLFTAMGSCNGPSTDVVAVRDGVELHVEQVPRPTTPGATTRPPVVCEAPPAPTQYVLELTPADLRGVEEVAGRPLGTTVGPGTVRALDPVDPADHPAVPAGVLELAGPDPDGLVGLPARAAGERRFRLVAQGCAEDAVELVLTEHTISMGLHRVADPDVDVACDAPLTYVAVIDVRAAAVPTGAVVNGG